MTTCKICRFWFRFENDPDYGACSEQHDVKHCDFCCAYYKPEEVVA
ncbi:hypothetical protein M0R72_08050 [Candidatus Pacearchaeota archaeon]|jgi:hypothetical protein|nr:hypothetical protein [Candidatus Pacearchaeota archaeon]